MESREPLKEEAGGAVNQKRGSRGKPKGRPKLEFWLGLLLLALEKDEGSPEPRSAGNPCRQPARRPEPATAARNWIRQWHELERDSSPKPPVSDAALPTPRLQPGETHVGLMAYRNREVLICVVLHHEGYVTRYSSRRKWIQGVVRENVINLNEQISRIAWEGGSVLRETKTAPDRASLKLRRGPPVFTTASQKS